MKATALKTGILCGSMLLAPLGCGSDSSAGGGSGGSAGQSSDVVEIFSWWIAPGEAEALQALVDVDKQRHTGERILNAAIASGTEARATLKTRLAESKPPDLFQQNAQDMRAFLENNPGKLVGLNDFFAKTSLTDVIVPEVLEDTKVDGTIYALPVNVHRENSLFYNMQVFDAHHIAAPQSLAEWIAACKTLKAAGITPIATVYQGWVQRILFNDIAMGSMGAKAFNDFITGNAARNDQALKTAIDVYADILQNYVNANASDSSIGWTDAAAMVFEGKAAMFPHGDWAKGYFLQLGWTADVDFGVVGAPGASELFWEDVDTFSLPVGALHSDGAYNFLDTIASIDGQVAFNRLKGSTPMRIDVPRERLDPLGQKTLDDLKNAQFRTIVRNQDAWDNGFQAFTTSMDKVALFQVYVDNPPVK